MSSEIPGDGGVSKVPYQPDLTNQSNMKALYQIQQSFMQLETEIGSQSRSIKESYGLLKRLSKLIEEISSIKCNNDQERKFASDLTNSITKLKNGYTNNVADANLRYLKFSKNELKAFEQEFEAKKKSEISVKDLDILSKKLDLIFRNFKICRPVSEEDTVLFKELEHLIQKDNDEIDELYEPERKKKQEEDSVVEERHIEFEEKLKVSEQVENDIMSKNIIYRETASGQPRLERGEQESEQLTRNRIIKQILSNESILPSNESELKKQNETVSTLLDISSNQTIDADDMLDELVEREVERLKKHLFEMCEKDPDFLRDILATEMEFVFSSLPSLPLLWGTTVGVWGGKGFNCLGKAIMDVREHYNDKFKDLYNETREIQNKLNGVIETDEDPNKLKAQLEYNLSQYRKIFSKEEVKSTVEQLAKLKESRTKEMYRNTERKLFNEVNNELIFWEQILKYY